MSLKQYLIIFVICLGLLIIIGYGVLKVVSKNYTRLKCTDFKNQQEAQEAYNRGATYLDRDKDGRACQNLPLKSVRKIRL